MTDWDLLLTDARIATLRHDQPGLGEIPGAAIGIAAGKLAWIGREDELPEHRVGEHRALGGRWVTPGLIDCHTHLVFGGDRSAEFEQRLAGVSYEDIARQGGGILSTVRDTRAASREELVDTALGRVRALAASGVTTVEIKSGYGLDTETEIRMLEVARALTAESGVAVVTSLLAAHTVPPEFTEDSEAYIDLICDELLPAVAERELADAVDAYCETIAFSPDQVARLFRRAQALGLPVKLHADQLSDGGGAELAASFQALSADHLEYSSDGGIAAMAKSGTVAVLLPGAFVTLNETRRPPVVAFREHGVPIAVATDCNPGTSPFVSLTEAMALACRLFALTPEECLAGTTRIAAEALGLDDRGTLDVGKRADLAIWDVEHPRELCYWLGSNPLSSLLIEGRDVSLT